MSPLKNVASDDKTRQKIVKNRSLCFICEHFALFFYTVVSIAVFLQRPHHV